MLLVGATSTAVNIVRTITHPNEGCSEDSVWKWIQGAQMEPHGTNPIFAFIFAEATTRSRWRKPTGERVGAAELHMDCLPSPLLREHSFHKTESQHH